jgi:rubredoxin
VPGCITAAGTRHQKPRLPEEAIMPSWKCSNCGYTFDKDQPPDECPSCKVKCEFLDNTCYTPDCAADGIDKRIK